MESVDVFNICRGQYVTIGDGFPWALNVTAVKDTMSMLGITDVKAFRRVVAVVNKHFIKKAQKAVTKK